ncbi:MAG: hypothetical protein IH600_07395 [Bacteroidetes bacterium]|nr:hypothetical protein [Bacteroidota bacterium]
MNDKNYSMTSQSIVGIVVLLLGVVLTLGNFDIINSSSVLRFWPVLLVVFGAIKAMQPGRSGGRLFGIIVAGIGILMLLDRMDIIWFEFWDLWPLILILVGGSLMLKSGRRHKVEKGESSSEYVSGMAILGGIEQRNSSLYFKGGSVSAIMGGHEIDLRNADIPENGEAVLEVFALMGGIELKVPEDWLVVLEGSAFLGGFESKARGGNGRKKFIIRGQAVLGGVEVRN